MSEYSVSLEKQEVLVKGTIPYEDLLAKIKKTGKEVSVLSYPDDSQCPNNITLIGSIWNYSQLELNGQNFRVMYFFLKNFLLEGHTSSGSQWGSFYIHWNPVKIGDGI